MSEFELGVRINSQGEFINRGVTIDAIVVRRNKLLLIKRLKEPCKDYWAIPGGYLNWDEKIEDTVARELKEETRLTATGLRLVGIYSAPDRHPNQAISIAYLVTATGRSKKGDDAGDLKWFKLNEIPKQLAFDHTQILRDAGVVK